MKSLAILGRQPILGFAELESLYGSEKIEAVLPNIALIDLEPENIDFNRLGGVLKLGQIISESSVHNLKKDLSKIIKSIDLPKNCKINLGLSAYGFNIAPANLLAIALGLKKELRKSGIGARVIPNNQGIELNTAQVLHNKLATDKGIEFLLVANKINITIARTRQVQNINDYSARDQARPKRDAFVGMLPPKLAQIILNLASGTTPTKDSTILDPFCGTGVLLQEALLCGFNVYGTDISPKMVDYSIANIEWLKHSWSHIDGKLKIELGDATEFRWSKPFDVVATETFLGEPLSTVPNLDKLNRIVTGVDILLVKFLKNIYPQLKSGQRLCLAVPSWKVNNGFKHLPCLDQLSALGYNRVVLKHASWPELIYHRPEQLVARELVILIKD